MVRWNLHRAKTLIVYCKPRISLGVALVAGAQVSFDHIFLDRMGPTVICQIGSGILYANATRRTYSH